jgi:hypothetical protein
MIMSRNTWDERGRSLEEEFFSRQNRELVEKLKQKTGRELSMKELTNATGIQDQTVLESLIEAGVTPSMVAALTLAPLVFVAWADGHVDEKERQAVLASAQSVGIVPGHDNYELLASWLNQAPDPKLFDSWHSYISGIRNVMKEVDRDRLRKDILDRSSAVAEATGSFLGIGRRISAPEKKVLERIETAFTADS